VPPGAGEEQVVFDDPIDVFLGLRKGLEEDAFSNYERAIGDDFVFSPLPSDSLDPTFPPGTFDDWTRQVELDVMRLVDSEAGSIEVEFTPSRLIDENTFVRYETEYTLTFVPRGGGDPEIYAGVAFIDVRRIGGVWQVTYWDESEPDDTYPSWGFLRGFYRGLLP
jgi:hypothetical protein